MQITEQFHLLFSALAVRFIVFFDFDCTLTSEHSRYLVRAHGGIGPAAAAVREGRAPAPVPPAVAGWLQAFADRVARAGGALAVASFGAREIIEAALARGPAADAFGGRLLTPAAFGLPEGYPPAEGKPAMLAAACAAAGLPVHSALLVDDECANVSDLGLLKLNTRGAGAALCFSEDVWVARGGGLDEHSMREVERALVRAGLLADS